MHVVIFTGGEAPLPQNTAFYFSRAPHVDYVIAADSGLDTLEAYSHFYGSTQSFEPDLILGDMDSIKDKSLLGKYEYVRSEIYNHDKDFTDTEMALINANEMIGVPGTDRVTLVGGCGGRLDHFISIYDTFSACYHPDVWLTTDQIVCGLQEGFSVEISNVSPVDRISVGRLTSSFEGGSVKSEGLAWESPCFRKNGMPSISNRISDDYYEKHKPVKLSSESGTFLVFVPYHALISIYPTNGSLVSSSIPGVV